MGSVQGYVEGLHFGKKRLTLAELGKMDVLKINDDDDDDDAHSPVRGLVSKEVFITLHYYVTYLFVRCVFKGCCHENSSFIILH